MDATIIDQATAAAALNKARDVLTDASDNYDARDTKLRTLIIETRPKGLLTVTEMAQAVGRDRNYIDSVWSANGGTVKGKQTRVPVAEGTSGEAARWAYESLVDAAADRQRALNILNTARAERNRVLVMVYVSELLGPSPIAREVGVDRNHVGRIARAAGVAPVHRKGSKNQYTSTS